MKKAGSGKLEEAPRRVREETQEEVEARTSTEVRKLLYAGQVRRSMQRGTSHGLADSHSPQVLQQMQVKFPARNDPLPATVPKLAPIDSFSQLRETLLSLEPGTSPGSGGCRPTLPAACRPCSTACGCPSPRCPFTRQPNSRTCGHWASAIHWCGCSTKR